MQSKLSWLISDNHKRGYAILITAKRIIRPTGFYLGSFLVVVVVLFPIVWMILTSFKSQVDAMSLPPRLFFRPILNNYADVLSQNSFLRYYLNSLIVCLASVTLSLIVGVPSSYVLSRFEFRRRKALTLWILSVRVAPPITFLIPFFLMYRRLHLIDTYLGLILIYTSINLTLSIILVRGFFKDIPIESEESIGLKGVHR